MRKKSVICVLSHNDNHLAMILMTCDHTIIYLFFAHSLPSADYAVIQNSPLDVIEIKKYTNIHNRKRIYACKVLTGMMSPSGLPHSFAVIFQVPHGTLTSDKWVK